MILNHTLKPKPTDDELIQRYGSGHDLNVIRQQLFEKEFLFRDDPTVDIEPGNPGFYIADESWVCEQTHIVAIPVDKKSE